METEMWVFQSFLFVLIHFKTYSSYKELTQSWNELAHHDIMLNTGYLSALEQALPSNITLYYVGIFKGGKLIGIALIQHVRLHLKDMFRRSSSSKPKTFFKNIISSVLKGSVLVVGNLTHTGQHGVSFLKEEINTVDFYDTVLNAVDTLKNEIKKKGGKAIRAILLKDHFDNDQIHEASKIFIIKKYSQVIVQPNMILNNLSRWENIEDYLKDLNKKYRARYNRARKKFGSIDRRQLSLEEIEQNAKKLHSLYMNVSEHARFNTFVLPRDHFLSLKKELQDSFRVYGYYLEGKLIGFYTLIFNERILETYFLGYDSKHQYKNQLYLNMLYDMLEFAVEHKFVSIVYARTAMEIKSSVGAKPLAMTMYIKHTNSFSNRILKLVFNFMKPNQKWEERHPFKE